MPNWIKLLDPMNKTFGACQAQGIMVARQQMSVICVYVASGILGTHACIGSDGNIWAV